MRFSPQILDEIRARLTVSQVVGRKVALKKKGREYSGLSPFKVEKTPSFFVNDAKGFYHCFASGEHGDIFTFLMKTEGLAFPEAVERLAQEAGVVLPKTEVHDQVREDERTRLLALMEEAAKFFQTSLAGQAGADARRYIEKRGLKRETLSAFRIGYAPNSRSALKDHLAKAGFTLDDMIASGMLISGDDIPVAYDRFRHRVIFPIGDAKGRIIAFGGRALDADQPAKYLNSPETPLFHKGHILFNAHRARPAAHDKGRIIAVEGYMDVISLAEAGFAETVAPLGTALTEDQLGVLWRLSPEPILCFDGDSAGQRAAHRAIDTALPHVKAGASLMFAFLPDGLDPDDLVRQQGAAALEDILSRARPLVDVLFEREWTQGDWSTPERRARLEQQLKALIARIEDETVRSHYRRDLARRLDQAWGGSAASSRSEQGFAHGKSNLWSGGRGYVANGTPAWRSQTPLATSGSGMSRGGLGSRAGFDGRRQGGRGFAPFQKPNASSSLKKSALAGGSATLPPHREALLLRTILNHPWLLEDYAEAIAALPFTSTALSRLRDAMLSAQALDNSLDTATLHSHLSKSAVAGTLGLVDRAVSHKCDKFAEPEAGRTEVEDGWRHALAMHERHVGLRRALEAAEQVWHEDRSEVAYARICDLQRQLEHLIGADAFETAGGEQG